MAFNNMILRWGLPSSVRFFYNQYNGFDSVHVVCTFGVVFLNQFYNVEEGVKVCALEAVECGS